MMTLEDYYVNKILNELFKESEHPRDEKGRFTDKNGNNQVSQLKDRGEVIYVKRDAIGKYTGDRKDYFNKFKKWYKENMQGKSVKSPVLDEVNFYAKGINETFHHNSPTIENLKYITVIPEILKTSRDVVKEKIKHPKQGVRCAYRITGEVATEDNKVKEIEVVVLEDTNGKRYYTFDATKTIVEVENKISQQGLDVNDRPGWEDFPSAHPSKVGGEREYPLDAVPGKAGSKGEYIETDNSISVYNITHNYQDVNIIIRNTEFEVIETNI